MGKTSKARQSANTFATRDDVVRVLGDLDDEDIVKVLELTPTVAEIEQAGAWLDGQGDAMARAGRPQTPCVAKILDIVDRGDEEPSYLR